jgi:hypothetical protein
LTPKFLLGSSENFDMLKSGCSSQSIDSPAGELIDDEVDGLVPGREDEVSEPVEDRLGVDEGGEEVGGGVRSDLMFSSRTVA